MVILSDDSISVATTYPMNDTGSMSYREDLLLSWHNPVDSTILQQAAASTAHMTVSYRDASKGPLRKLSVDLIRTYKHINDVSFLIFTLISALVFCRLRFNFAD
jgi:hypothetical protein